MVTKDLRIGNVLQRKRDGIIVDVLEVLTTRILYVNPDLSRIKPIAADLNGFEPIPLSEYWLTHFGFESKWSDGKGRKGYSIKGMYVFTYQGGERFYAQYESGQFIIKIKSVHQLQNLYFALTGTELAATLVE